MTTATIYRHGPISRLHYGACIDGNFTDDRAHKQLMRDWYGLTPMTGHSWRYGAQCPHHVVGRRCELHYNLPAIWDHPRAWRDSDGIKVVTLEPWGNPFASVEEYARLEAECQDFGINIRFEGRSPYGASYILFLKRAGVPLQGHPADLDRVTR